jgi:predicted ArsR family transcriptional regulator
MEDGRTPQVAAVAALAEPTRRRLYDYVVRRPEPVGRDEAAAAVGVPRATTAFHLDRLVADGLLETSYERRSGRTGPGAGRPAKLYRRASCPVAVSLPERHYDLAADLLAAALEDAEPSPEVLARLAAGRGRDLGGAVRATAGDGPAGGDLAVRGLEEHGFEPRAEDGGITLANCPFHTLAQRHPDLVCGMTVHLLAGLLEGVGETGLVARLSPAPGRCCVRLEPAASG